MDIQLGRTRSIASALQELKDGRSYLTRCLECVRTIYLKGGELLWRNAHFSFLTGAFLPIYDWLRVSIRSRNLAALHERLKPLRDELSHHKRFYDYGHAYFYQSLASVFISGRRCTEARIEEYGLEPLCSGRRVLDLGSNVCFLAIQLSKTSAAIDCVDISPYALNIGRTVAAYLQRGNLSFNVGEYQKFLSASASNSYDVILLLSSHISFDQTDATHIGDLFSECSRTLKPGGILVFESHQAFFEEKYAGITRTFSTIAEYFEVLGMSRSRHGTLLDVGRLIAYCRRR